MEKIAKRKKDILHITCVVMFAACVMLGSYFMLVHGLPSSKQDGYKVFCMIGMVLVVGVLVTVYLLQYYKNVRIEKIYIACGMSLGILFLFLIPPYATPDEETHWKSTYQVSNNIMQIQAKDANSIKMRECDIEAQYTPEVTREYFDYLFDNLFKKAKNTELVDCNTSITGVSNVLYLPAAIGVTLGRLLRAGSVMTMFLGGLFNVVFFVLCSYYAMKKLPFGKRILFVFCLLPMTLQQTSSYSYDNIILAAMVVVVAMALHWAYSGEEIEKKEIVIYLLASYVLLVGKGGTYAVLCFLPFVLKCTKERINRKNIGIMAAFVAFAAIIMLTGSIGLYTSSGSDMAVGENAGRAYISWADSYSYTIMELLGHPKLLVTIFINTILVNADYYLENMIGSPLGWLNIYLPDVVIYGFILLLFLAAISNSEEEVHFRIKDKCVIWLMCLASCGISMAAMLLYWTPKGWDRIMGVQGRYFLPMLFPFLLTLRGKRLQWKTNCDIQISVATMFLNMLVVFFLLRTFM